MTMTARAINCLAAGQLMTDGYRSSTGAHYTAWLRDVTGWVAVSDSTERSVRALTPNLSGYVMLFFEKL